MGRRQGEARPLKPEPYRLKIHPKAVRELAALPKGIQRRTRDDLDLLAADPRPAGRVKQIDKEIFRIRAGDYRTVYRVDDARRLVAVLLIGHRRNVYDVLRRSDRESWNQES
ncbi:MAG TPA: type II toxin-antitoxin system RelE/ParE family toxin [Thermoanaerobaculia bacterium]